MPFSALLSKKSFVHTRVSPPARHSVLARASYGEHLVLYQNCTVGKNHGVAPVLEGGVVLYPNSAVIGRSRVRAMSVIAQGVSVLNRDTDGDCLVFQGVAGDLVFKPAQRGVLADIFRDV